MEEYSEVQKPYDLESISIPWESLNLQQDSPDRCSAAVNGREIGRAVALAFAKEYGCAHIARGRLENPKPIEDHRLDGIQLSFGEYDKDYELAGEIVMIDFFLRNSAGDKEYLEKFNRAVKQIREKIEKAKNVVKAV